MVIVFLLILIAGRSETFARSQLGATLLTRMPIHEFSVREAFRLGVAIMVIAAFLSTLLSAFTMPLQAASYADYVHNGNATSIQPIGPFLQFEVRADQAKAYIKGSLPVGLRVPRDITFLGQHDGVVILWDSRNQAVYRIPAGDVVLISGNCADAAVPGVGAICRD